MTPDLIASLLPSTSVHEFRYGNPATAPETTAVAGLDARSINEVIDQLSSLHRSGAPSALITPPQRGMLLPPSTATDLTKLKAMVDAFHTDDGDDAWQHRIVMVPATRREIKILMAAFRDPLPMPANWRIVRALGRDLRDRISAMVDEADQTSWEQSAHKVVREHSSGVGELMWATHWLTGSRTRWHVRDEPPEQARRRIDGVNAKSADAANPAAPMRGYNNPARTKLLDQPVLVPILARELAALRAGIQEPAAPTSVNVLDLLLADWASRSEDLYTKDPDTTTLQSLIRRHSSAMNWCDSIVLTRILKASP